MTLTLVPRPLDQAMAQARRDSDAKAVQRFLDDGKMLACAITGELVPRDMPPPTHEPREHARDWLISAWDLRWNIVAALAMAAVVVAGVL